MRLTLSICLLIISSCVFAQVNLNQGLLAYYPFSGNANDATGNGNNGTLMNGVQLTTDRFGNPNSAYHFDGIDDYIIVNDNGNLSPQNVTVVAMVYAEQSTAQSITGKIQYTTGYHATYHLGINYDIQSGFFWGLDPSGFSCYQQIPYDPINNPFVTSPAYFSPNVWHCVVGTFENSVQKLYVDGVLVGTRIDNFTSLDQCTNTNFLIGRWWTGDPIPFKGKIDEVRVYNRALNQAEINALCEYSSTQFSCNNWLNTPSLPSFFSTLNQVNVTGNQITVEALINRTTPYSGGPLYAGDVVSKHNDPTDVNYLLRPNTAEITTSTGYHRTPDVCDIQLNKTYHVAMVYDGTTLKFYRNGFLMSQTNATGNLVQNNWQTRVGFYQSAGFNTNFIGYINEVRIWNVARTQAQIQGYMNSSLPSPTTQSGLLAYYIYDNLLNKQGNPAYNGTLGGSAAINQTNPNCSLIIDSCATTPPPTFGCSGSQFAIGGTGYDRAFDVAATTNNEYYVAGVSKSFSGNDDLLITRVTNAGNTVWAKK